MTDQLKQYSEQYKQSIIDINVRDPRIMRKTIMDKYVLLNYNLNNSSNVLFNSPMQVVSPCSGNTTFTSETHSSFLREYYNQEQTALENNVCDFVENPEHYFSIILDKETARPLSIAPSVPISLCKFIQKYPIGTEHIQINPMNEGTLVQTFFDTVQNDWELATKSSIGANNRHYRTEYHGYTFQEQKTFRQMFYDALTQVTVGPKIVPDSNPDGQVCDLKYNATETYYNTRLRDIPYIQTLDKSCCYSYIIAHPSNIMTNTIIIPTITLVAVCKIMPYGLPSKDNVANPGKYLALNIPQEMFVEMIPTEYRKIVRVQPFMNWLGKSLEEETLNFMFLNDVTPGLMFTNIRTGERAVLENLSYQYTAQLRGNHQNLQYQFFELHCANRLGEFLSRFPVFTNLFTYFFNQYYDFTFRVYSIYVEYYIHKNREFVNYIYHRHAAKIHREIFLASMTNGIKTPITREIVQHYFDRMTPSQLLYIVSTSGICSIPGETKQRRRSFGGEL